MPGLELSTREASSTETTSDYQSLPLSNTDYDALVMGCCSIVQVFSEPFASYSSVFNLAMLLKHTAVIMSYI